MNKKYEKLKQKALLKLILARQEQLIVELRAMHLYLEDKIGKVAEINMHLNGVKKIKSFDE